MLVLCCVSLLVVACRCVLFVVVLFCVGVCCLSLCVAVARCCVLLLLCLLMLFSAVLLVADCRALFVVAGR